jgi:hypothetical protein
MERDLHEIVHGVQTAVIRTADKVNGFVFGDDSYPVVAERVFIRMSARCQAVAGTRQ